MGLLDLFDEESYEVECERCGEALKIEREEVEEGEYRCPVCGHRNSIPKRVEGEYKKNRAREEEKRKKEEQKRKENERKKREREKRRAEAEERQKKERGAKQRARREKLKKQREKERAKKESLKAGKCPNCGSELQVLQKGYDTGTGVACCLLGGPVGLLGGLLGSGKKTRVCKGCGQEFSFGSQKQDSAAAVVVIVLLVVFSLILLASC